MWCVKSKSNQKAKKSETILRSSTPPFEKGVQALLTPGGSKVPHFFYSSIANRLKQKKMKRTSDRYSSPVGLLLLIGLVTLTHRRHDFVLLEAEAFVSPKQSSASFRFAKSSFLESTTQVRIGNFRQQQTHLFSTSASAAAPPPDGAPRACAAPRRPPD